MIVDVHHHLETLNELIQLRGKIQGHSLSLKSHMTPDSQVLLSVPLYVTFYRNYSDLKKMIREIKEQISESGEGFKLIVHKEDLKADFKVGVILHVESGRVLKNFNDQLEELFELGIRGVIPIHFIDNHIGTSCDDPFRRLQLKKIDHGLTEIGKHFIDKCNDLGLWVDLTHTSDKTGDEIMLLAKKVMVSHTGIREKVKIKRNKPIEFLKKVAKRKGLIGLSPWMHLCGSGLNDYKNLVNYAKLNNLEDFICIGSDFGAPIGTTGNIKSIFDISVEVNDKKFLYLNALKFFENNLPN